MRLVVQRVTHAHVDIEEKTVGSTDKGLMVLVGVEEGDTQEDAAYCAEKTANLRIFEDGEGKMNRSVLDIGGGVLAISQFTLLGDVRRGRRPSFIKAARPDTAAALYDAYCDGLRAQGLHVGTGVFQTHMQIHLCNDGPVTLLVDSRRCF